MSRSGVMLAGVKSDARRGTLQKVSAGEYGAITRAGCLGLSLADYDEIVDGFVKK